jgi:hypothetical protein
MMLNISMFDVEILVGAFALYIFIAVEFFSPVYFSTIIG